MRLELARTKALTLPSSTAGLSENNFELEVFLSISPHALMVCLPPFRGSGKNVSPAIAKVEN